MKQNEESTELETETTQSLSGISPGEIIIGTLTGIDEQGCPLVNYSGNSSDEPQVAVTTVGVDHQQLGRQVALLFANSDPQSPVIIGLIHSPLHEMIANYQPEDTKVEGTESEQETEQDEESKIDDVFIDGKRVVIEGQEEIVLKCGDSSITLTKEGKILIRGKYLLNRSTGVNRIMGGSVQVN